LAPLKRELSFFDLTNIVVGAIVGSDIYIASAITAGIIGPFSIVVWVVAGVIAAILASVFAYSSFYVPRVGGSFAYVSTAFGDFYGFLAGWSMWVAEVLALPVFAITFTNYLGYFAQLGFVEQVAVKFLFIFGLTLVNIVGVKAAGRVNDALTVIKLLPLFLIVIVGLGSFALNPGFAANYSPLAPHGLGDFGTALVLIFWAYVGFELGTLPADEVKEPGRTIPRAIMTGMVIVTLFYLSTNFVIFGAVRSSALATTAVPLVFVGAALLGSAGGAIMSVGALFSVSGSDESGILGTSRLSYAMSIDGLFPKAFSRVHKKYGTPYQGLVIQGALAFALSIVSGLSSLISFSVLCLSFCFLLVSVSLVVLVRRSTKAGLRGARVLPWLGALVSVYLIYSTSLLDKLVGSAVILAGVPLYVYFSPKVDAADLKDRFVSEEAILERSLDRTHKFLANALRLLRNLFRK